MHQLGDERMNRSFHLRNTPEFRSGMFHIVDCPICGMKTMDFYWICEHCGWEYDDTAADDEESGNAMPPGEYRELYKIGGVGMLPSGRSGWVINLHPRHIPVTKKELNALLFHFNLPKALICALSLGKDRPRFEEWLIKACYQLQTVSSFVYIVNCSESKPPFTRKAVKLPMKRYEELLFDPFCKNADECRRVLEGIAEKRIVSESDITDETVERVFEKFCAVKRYTLPMLANTEEFEYFSFYRYILLYVIEHDNYPEFPIVPLYRYPLLPGMCECDIDFDW